MISRPVVQITESFETGWLLEKVMAEFISFLGFAIGGCDGATPYLMVLRRILMSLEDLLTPTPHLLNHCYYDDLK